MADAQRIVLFRGLNVGRSKRLSMAALRRALETAGCRDVRTYLQSGNAVLRPPGDVAGEALEERIAEAVSGAFAAAGGPVATFVLTVDDLRTIVDANPYREAAAEPTKLHLFLFRADLDANAERRLEELATPRERVAIVGRTAYLHAPDGIGRSKLASRMERAVGAPATARNWRTVTSLLELAEG